MNSEERDELPVAENQGPIFMNPHGPSGSTIWQYEQLRAGQVYSRFLFNTREEAEDFATEMTKVAPDLFGRVGPVEAKAIWN